MTEVTDDSNGTQTGSDKTRTFKVGVITRGFFTIPVLSTIETGLFEKFGLTVELVDTLGKTNYEELETGELDICAWPPEGAIKRIETGFGKVKIVAGSASSLVLDALAKPQFKKIEDLKGAVFGTIPADGGTKFVFVDMARAHGLEPGDYEVNLVGAAPLRWKALQAGTIDVGLLPPPLSFMAEDVGFNNIASSFDYYPDYQFAAYQANTERSAEDNERLINFLHALMLGTKWAYSPENKDRVVEIAQDKLKLSADYAARAWDLFYKRQAMPWDLGLNRIGIEKVMSLSIRAGNLPEDTEIDVDKYIYSDFHDQARARMDHETS